MEGEQRRVSPSYIDEECKHYEVLFPNDFTQRHPSGHNPGKWHDPFPHIDEYVEELKNIKLPIYNLVHITHNTEAGQIRRKFSFEAKRKVGKTRDDGETFRFEGQGKKLVDIQPKDPVYAHISDTEPVFPGYYSWWDIDYSVIPNHGQFTSPYKIAGVLIGGLLYEERMHVSVPGYLKYDYPKSIYGNRAFSCKFRDLIQSYAASRRSDVGKICIRKGGTLRYKKEICYVLIICIDCDEDREELSEYGVLQEQWQFQEKFSGFTNLLDYETTPTFNPEYIIAYISLVDHYSYETAAFAFYFPDKDGVLATDQRFCSEAEIKHDKELCIKKKPPPEGGKWKCPNDL